MDDVMFKKRFGYERKDMELFHVGAYAEGVFGIQVPASDGFHIKVHPRGACKLPDQCVVHNPSDHHMRDWVLNWRQDTAVMERLCEHGVGHPDPDDMAFQKSVGQGWKGTHGCDGCCVDGTN